MAIRSQDIVNLRRNGATFQEIADNPGIRLSVDYVRKLFYDEMKKIPQAEVLLLRQEATERLDAMRSLAAKILLKRHVKVNTRGQVIDDGNGNYLEDPEPVLKALALMLEIEKEVSMLWGLRAATTQKHEIQAIAYEIIGVDPEEVLH
jgi:hypothetical protein